MKTCYIVGAVESSFVDFNYTDDDLIIACDKGYEILTNHNYRIDIVVGDFDSLNYTPSHPNTTILPKEKDITDVFAAIKIAKEKNYQNIILISALGEKLDHSYANIQHLRYLVDNGMQGCLLSPNEKVLMLKNNIYKVKKAKGRISIFAYNYANEVTIKNLKYEVTNINLDDAFPLGVSNEFIDKEAIIEVKNGYLLIIEELSA